MTNWKPIETAPRDGSNILLANSKGVWIGMYREFYLSGGRRSNPWMSMMLNQPPNTPWTPTHWMPLPKPPNPRDK